MKKVLLSIFAAAIMLTGCGGIESEVESRADELIKTALTSSHNSAERQHDEIVKWIKSLDKDDKKAAEKHYDEYLEDGMAKALDEEITTLAEEVKAGSKTGMRSANRALERIFEKLDKVMLKVEKSTAWGSSRDEGEKTKALLSRAASKAIRHTLADKLKDELVNYATPMCEAVKSASKTGLKTATRNITKWLDKCPEECKNIRDNVEDAFYKVLNDKFYELAKEDMAEYKSIAMKGDIKGAEKWLKDYEKRIDKLLKDAEYKVSSEYTSAVGRYSREITEELKQ